MLFNRQGEGRNSMKKAVYTAFCFMAASCIFSITAFAEDYNNRAIAAFQKFRTLNEAWTTAFLSGGGAAQGDEGKMLAEHKKNELAYILESLPEKYCAEPHKDVLREFMKTIISTANSGDEYPTYVFAELYACDPDGVSKEILSLTSDDQKVIVENLSYGFKNIAYKVESLPNYKELIEKLKNLKSNVR